MQNTTLDYVADPTAELQANAAIVRPTGLAFRGKPLAHYSLFAQTLWMQLSRDSDGGSFWIAQLMYVLAKLGEYLEQAHGNGISDEDAACRFAAVRWFQEHDGRALETRALIAADMHRWDKADLNAARMYADTILAAEKETRIAEDDKPTAEPTAEKTKEAKPGKARCRR